MGGIVPPWKTLITVTMRVKRNPNFLAKLGSVPVVKALPREGQRIQKQR